MEDGTPDALPEFLTVKELAALLRLKERKVYDLAASGAVPCSRATGKLLFPEAEIRAWIAQASNGPAKRNADTRPPPNVFLGSHDPLLEWALRQSRCGIATFLDGSMDGLNRLRAGEGVAAGVHIYDAKEDAWNVPVVEALFAGQNMVLVRFAARQRGLVVATDKLAKITSVADLQGHRLAARQAESGTARVLAAEVARAGLSASDLTIAETARSEMDAVLAVAQGSADVTFGLAPLAGQFGLGFVPVVTECFDLLVDRKAWFDAGLQAFWAFCQSADFAKRAKAEAGYDISGLGEVRWNG